MMKYRWSMILFLATIFLPSPSLYAHGVRGKVEAGGVVVSAEYSTGEPMSYAKVKISAPGAKFTFQSGRTDRNGRFCFFPDAPGDWEVAVDDEMGHRLEVKVPVNETLTLQTNEQRGEAGQGFLSRYQKALMGVCTLFGIFGILFWWVGRKNRRVS